MKTFVLHDESLNNYGFWALTSGCDLTQFQKNPLMLWCHSRSWGDKEDEVLPIGHWENIRIEGDQILADAAFDADEFSQKIAAKVESGTLRMASAGLRVIEESNDPKYIKVGQRYATVLKWAIKEASIVDIGANNNALALYDHSGKIMQLSDNGSDIPLRKLQPQNEIEMKKLALVLNLKDDAKEDDYVNAVSPILDENKTLRADLQTEKDEKKALQDKLDAIELKDKEAKTKQATDLIDAAIKDGRLNDDEKHTAKAFWLRNFDGNFEEASVMLAALPKREGVRERLKDGGKDGEGAWEKRQREIEENSKKK
jgi:hypothetical protein